MCHFSMNPHAFSLLDFRDLMALCNKEYNLSPTEGGSIDIISSFFIANTSLIVLHRTSISSIFAEFKKENDDKNLETLLLISM